MLLFSNVIMSEFVVGVYVVHNLSPLSEDICSGFSIKKVYSHRKVDLISAVVVEGCAA